MLDKWRFRLWALPRLICALPGVLLSTRAVFEKWEVGLRAFKRAVLDPHDLEAQIRAMEDALARKGQRDD